MSTHPEWAEPADYRQGGVVRPRLGVPPGQRVERPGQPVAELRAAGPGGFARAVTVIRDLLACLALLLVSVLMALLLTTVLTIGQKLGQIDDQFRGDTGPVPTGTGCPFGDGQCGG